MTGDSFEQWLARLENRHEQLRDAFHAHAEQAVHTSFVDVVQDIRAEIKVLQTRWLQVGGSVIFLLITILLSLLGVLWTLSRPTAPVTAPSRVTCGQFVSQASAQEFYRSNPVFAASLDGDRDGVACVSNSAPFDRQAVNP